jgi:3-methylfumaryl-CoA hydratase
VQALHASLGSVGSAPVGELPLLWHWLYFLETPHKSETDPDGHALRGSFFPPVEQPRRMLVGSRSRYHCGLRIGETATILESIQGCERKQGRSGDMTLVKVGYEYRQNGVLCIEEERDFMYLPARSREDGEQRTAEEVAVPDAPLTQDVLTDPVLLFRFSALTFNGHRIHYDSDYARNVEGYPGLVVHGPLIALLLAQLVQGSGAPLETFNFHARAPLYVGDRIRLRGLADTDRYSLVAYRPDGQVAMIAEATQ